MNGPLSAAVAPYFTAAGIRYVNYYRIYISRYLYGSLLYEAGFAFWKLLKNACTVVDREIESFN